MAECKHGFEDGLCDICFPRQAPEPAKRAATTTARRPAASRSAAGSAAPRVQAPRTSSRPTMLLNTQRVYHVTHLHNLEAIVIDEAIRADASPEVDVSSTTTRELRASVELASGGFVADRVPFQLSPNASRWNELRSGAAGPHWSDAARAANPLEFVILVTSGGAVGPDILFANGDAAAPATRFAAGDAGTALLRSTYALDPELLDAELLAAAPVPFSAITLVGVANEPVRDLVRQLLADVGGAAPKVAVYPPWFQGE
ncbi:MAG: DarT ssDNA thymidine ADP-ribosyltransferase family protein [Pseudolysinimonas sp.]